jgi:NNP family nitrate/nitrite transporter-like MFS transporter
MANGATYSIVPFINPKAVGSVAGIVGAGGNIGAMLIGFMFKSMSYTAAFFYLGTAVFAVGILVLIVRIANKKIKSNQVIDAGTGRSKQMAA